MFRTRGFIFRKTVVCIFMVCYVLRVSVWAGCSSMGCMRHKPRTFYLIRM